jgi:Universal stress protein family
MRSAASGRRSGSKSRPPSSRSPRRIVELSPENDALPSRHFAVKHILVCVDGTDKDRSVLDQALQIALRFGSHIDVLHVRFDVHGTTSDRHERQVDRLLDKPVEHIVAETAARARRHFEEWHAQCKLPLRDRGTAVHGPSSLWREMTGYEDDIIARLGRVSDLRRAAGTGRRSRTHRHRRDQRQLHHRVEGPPPHRGGSIIFVDRKTQATRTIGGYPTRKLQHAAHGG